ncbi:MAG TPA: hypothetical protein VGP79_16840 [Bryobacteraceae bacterium]|nr:hypothetical protein [Bryobacteraceae bacterium]
MRFAVPLRLALFASSVCAVAWAATFGRVTPLVGGAADLMLDEPRSRVYLSGSNTSQLQIFSIAQQRFLAPITVDALPLGIALARSGKFLYVACYNASSLNIVDLDALAVTSRISLPAKPEAVAVGRDGRVLISTSGSGIGNGQNVLLLYDPAATTNSVTAISVAPPVSTPPTLPAPSNRAFLSARSQLLANRDGSIIVGVNLPVGANRVAFVYESVSATVLRSRTVTGTSSVLSISDDGTRFMCGPILFETSTLTVLAQQNTANATYPFAPNANFNLQSNQGGSVFSPDGQTLYTAFDIAPVNGAPNVSQLMANDPDNLLIRTGFQLPENLSGKMVMSSDGANIFALSDSGLITLPISTIPQSPLAVPASTAVLLTNDQCGVTAQTALSNIAINNPGRGRATAAATLLQVPGAAGGVASPATAPSVQTSNGTNNATIRFSFNSAAARGVGTITPPHDFVITSPEAINIPDRIRVYENNRDTEARGAILPIATGISAAEQLEDLIYDQPRQRLYIANSGLNRVEIYDIRQGRFLTPIKVGQLPRSMALTPDGSLLYVANSGAETISIVDPDKLQTVDRILFPPIPFNANLALSTPRVIAASNSGVMIFVGAAAGTGSLWKVSGNTAVPRGASIVIGSNVAGQPNPIPGPVSMAATPGGEFVLLATPAGNLYLYDPLADDFVQGRTIAIAGGYIGPIVAGPRGQYFVVNGMLLNQALTPVTQAAVSQASSLVQISATTFARSTQPTRPAAANTLPTTAPTVDIVDATTGAQIRQAPMLEGPQTTLAAGGARATISARTMAIDASGNTAYVITASGLSIVPLTPVVGADRPLPANRGTVNLASYQAQVSPNGLISIFGQNLGQLEIAGSTPLPTILGGTCVTLNNIPLPLFMVSPTQINAQIPPTMGTGSFPLIVRSVARQAASTQQNLAVTKYSPAVFVDPSGQIALFHNDGRYVNREHPANRDEPLTLYALGLGPPATGRITSGQPSPFDPLATITNVQVFFGNPDWVQGEVIVDWAGLAPGLIGVYQLNVRVPGFHIKGDGLIVTVRIGGVDSPSTGVVVPTVTVN